MTREKLENISFIFSGISVFILLMYFNDRVIVNDATTWALAIISFGIRYAIDRKVKKMPIKVKNARFKDI